MRRKKNFFQKVISFLLVLGMIVGIMPAYAQASASSDNGDGTFTNPVIYSDVPDLDVIRVGDVYYMVSTTMHMSPGCPVMKSTDMVNWEIVNYVYDTLGDEDKMALRNGESDYGNGSWAASLRYFKEKYYVSFASLSTGKTYVYSTADIENGPWHKSEFDGYLHDVSLLTDGDKMYVVYGGGTALCRELSEDENGDITFGEEFTLIEHTALDNEGNQVNDSVSYAVEGIHAYKIGDYYYLFIIQWPTGGRRQEICWRSKTLDSNGWESKKVFDSGLEFDGQMDDAGVAQGGVVETADGKWYSYLFQDHGSVGRIPVLVPVEWEEGWPVFGNEDGEAEAVMNIPGVSGGEKSIVASDEFYNGETRKIYSDTETDSSASTDAASSSAAETASAADTVADISLMSEESKATVELLTNGGFENGTESWSNQQPATLTEVTDEKASGEKAVKVTERTLTASGPKQEITGKLTAGQEVTVSAKVKYDEGPDARTFNICIQNNSDGNVWDGIEVAATAEVKRGEWTTIEGTYTIPEDADLSYSGIFVETSWVPEPTEENDLMDFYVDDVSCSYMEDYGLIINGGFESGLEPWQVQDGEASLTVTDDDAASGSCSLLTTERKATGSGPMQDLTGKVEAGKTYQVTAKVKYTTGPDSRDFAFTFRYPGGKYENAKITTVKRGEWTTIEGTYKVPADADVSDVCAFLETTWVPEPAAENDLFDFYVDDVSIVEEVKEDQIENGENDYNGSNLNLVWQWNHNPNNNNWSLTERNGYLRLTTGNTVSNILEARNTLTQRTYGPTCSGDVALEISGMKNGDVAGLAAFQLHYGYVGVKMENDTKYLVMAKTETDDNPNGNEIERVELDASAERVYLRADFDYTLRTDKATFYYSLDGNEWTQIGDTLQMAYTLPHFMGYRFALFNYATIEEGGYVDFDYFHVGDGGDESASTVLNASLKDIEGVPGVANTEVELPVQLDVLPEGTYSKMEVSMNVPEEFTVSDVTFDSENVSGNTSWSCSNGQLILSVTGEGTDYKDNGGSGFATVTLKVSDYIIEDTTTTVRTDYVKVTGGDVSYNVDNAVSDISMTKLDTDALAKIPGYSNPVIDYDFGADPFALVYDGRVYLYMTADQFEYDSNGNIIDNSYGYINKLHVVSSADMVNWTDHGFIQVAGPNGAATWATNSWAPAVAYKQIDGVDKFFLYFCNGAGGIGVLEGDSPVGPFRDPNRHALIDANTPGTQGVTWIFDPAVMVDDDGTGYLVFGGGVPNVDDNASCLNPQTARIVKLDDNMTSLANDADGVPQMIDAPCMFEDGGIHKANGKYYYTYCSNFDGDHSAVDGYPGYGNICYMVSDDPMGPYEYGGEILQNPYTYFGVGGNNHHAIFTFNGKSYITYHAQTLGQAMGIEKGYRSTHINEVEYYADGSIKEIIADREGVSQLETMDPYVKTAGETIAWQYGIQVTECSEAGDGLSAANNRMVTGINSGDWVAVSGLDFGLNGAVSFTANIASEAGGTIELRLDSPEGGVVGTLSVPAGNGSWQELSCEVEGLTGTHNIFFVFAGDEDADNLMSIDYWQFTEKETSVPDKSALADVLDRASKIDITKYTEETVAKMQAAFSAAQKVYDNPDATEDDIAEAVKALEDALTNLELKTDDSDYEVIEGSDSKWTEGSDSGLVFTISDGELDHIEINGEVIDPSLYTFDADSMTITIHPDYLNSLDAGVYAISFVYSDGGVAQAKLTVTDSDSGDGGQGGSDDAKDDTQGGDGQGGQGSGDKNDQNKGNQNNGSGSTNGKTVQTGDTTNVFPIAITAILAAAAAVAVIVIRKRRR